MENTTWDYKTILVVLAVGAVFIGWQKYLEVKYPEYYKLQKNSEHRSAETLKEQNTSALNPSSLKFESTDTWQDGQKKDMGQLTTSARKFIIETTQWKGELNSLGMRLENVVDKKYTDRAGKPIHYSSLGFLFQIVDKKNQTPILFNVNQVDNSFVGEAIFSDGTIMRRIFRVDSEGFIDVETKIDQASSEFNGWLIRSQVSILDTSASFLNPSQDQTQLAISDDRVSYEHHRIDKEWQKEWSVVGAFSMSTLYFASALVEKGDLLPRLITKAQDQFLLVDADYVLPPIGSGLTANLSQRIYLGPKSASKIASIEPSLSGIIDFGFFSTIGGILLRLLKIFYEWTGNWGWAILVLTLVVRILVLPFNIVSYRSMKKMQLIQPKLQALRERYKDDPMTMNRESMELMKKEKVNPLGGCLPMLLQMPVFFALYQVLSNAIELYQAPFIWWIHDLSAKDPYYILPALMGATLWIQHKLTPSTLDPTQAKIMGFMPILFTLFTLGLPSGLTFYIFVSTLFGVIQQKLFMNTHLSQASNND